MIADEVVNPDPGERSECDFERTGPVHSAYEGIGGDPAFDFLLDFAQVFCAAGDEESLSNSDEVLVAVQLPDPFVIANGIEIEIRNTAKKSRAAGFVVFVIAAPVDFEAGRNALAEEGEAMLENVLGYCDQFRRQRGVTHECSAVGGIRKRRRGRKRFFEADVRRMNVTPGIHELLAQPECDFTRATHER